MVTPVGSLTHKKGIVLPCTSAAIFQFKGHVFVSDMWYCMQRYAESMLDVLNLERRYCPAPPVQGLLAVR